MKQLYALIGLFCLTTPCVVPSAAFGQTVPGAGVEYILPEPDLPNIRLNFNSGQVGKSAQSKAPVFPEVSGATSLWKIGQWNRNSPIDPHNLMVNDSGHTDPRLGPAVYSVSSADGESRVSVYKDASANKYVYELYERNGTLVNGGGSNLFLSATPLPNENNMSGTVYYQMQVKVSKASISYDNPQAQRTGAVKAMAFTGFGLQYIYPHSAQGITVFMQIPLTSPGATTAKLRKPFDFCRIFPKGGMTFITGYLLPGEEALPFESDNGPLHLVKYNLTAHLSALLNRPHKCKSPNGLVTFQFSGPMLDMANWKLQSTFMGLETENTDKRQQSADQSPQGQVELAVQYSGIKAWRTQ